MISGQDIVIRSGPVDKAFPLVLWHCRRMWPDAWVEDGEGEWAAPIREVTNAQSEIFVYENRAVMEEIDEHGVTPQTDQSMLHVILEKGQATLVVADDQVLGEMHDALRQLLLALQS